MNRRQLLSALQTLPLFFSAPVLSQIRTPNLPRTGSSSEFTLDEYSNVFKGAAAAARLIGAVGGGGDSSAYLKAISGQLNVAISQLASIQKSLAYLIARMDQIDTRIGDMLDQRDAQTLRAGVLQFANELDTSWNAAIEAGTPLTRAGGTKYWREWQQQYSKFNDARSALRTRDKVNASVDAVLISTLCPAIDSQAWALGVIDDYTFARRLGEHATWLTVMEDPRQKMSFLPLMMRAAAQEKAIVEFAGTNPNTPDDQVHLTEEGFEMIRSDIAARLYRDHKAAWCLKHNFEVESWFQGDVIPQYQKMGVYAWLLAVRLQVDEKIDNEAGARIFDMNITEVPDSRGYAQYLPGTATPSMSVNMETIDMKMCEEINISKFRFTKDDVEKANARSYKLVVPAGHASRNSNRWLDIIADPNPKSPHLAARKDAVTVFRQINVYRYKLAYAAACRSVHSNAVETTKVIRAPFKSFKIN